MEKIIDSVCGIMVYCAFWQLMPYVA